MRKKLIMGAALAALIASPALAQSYDPSIGSGNIVPPLSQPYPMVGGVGTAAYSGNAGSAYAYQPRGANSGYAYTPRRGYRHRVYRSQY